jgi:transcriptional regulator with XRE-family HTH domain
MLLTPCQRLLTVFIITTFIYLSIGSYKLQAKDDKCHVTMSATMNTFSEWLNQQIKQRGWTQAELARQADVSRTSISDVLSEKRNVGHELAMALAQGLKIAPEEVYRQAGLLPKGHQINDYASRLAYRISQLPEEDQEVIDVLIDGLTRKRGQHSEQDSRPSGKTPLPQPD